MSDNNIQDNILKKPGGYISKIIFKNGQCVDIEQDDIVVFVGSNNTGKSQSLIDIYELCENKKQSIVIDDIEIIKRHVDLSSVLNDISAIEDHGNYKSYHGLGFGFTSHSITNHGQEKYYDSTRPLFVTYLNTLNRLTICNPAKAIIRNEAKQHPIHYAAFNGKYRKWLSESFKKAFGKELIPNTQYGATIPLCIGDPVRLSNDFEDEQERQEEYAKVLDTYNQVQKQGDGIKSFTGILLYLMLDYFCTFLIDEPESFLHPPQANIMGRIIGETLRNHQQAFISTHSEDIIKGLLSICPERIKIIRITRDNDNNAFSILDNKKFKDVWNDSLLKHSNIMSSLFHKEVVLCESDADCRMYSLVENHIKFTKGKYSETLFIHCGGKQRMAKIVTALKTLNIRVKLIPDIDVLNDENIFRSIIEAFNIEWDCLSKDYNIVVSNLHSPIETINRNDFKTTSTRILDASTQIDLSKKEIKALIDALKVISKWVSIKESGIAAIPSGDATRAFNKINKTLQEHDIYIVPVGELEGFIKDIGNHGPEWVNNVIETYPDINNPVYDKIKKFINSIDL